MNIMSMNNTSKKEVSCTHDVYIKGLCGNCGIRLDPPQSTSVSMIHSVPELKVSEEYAKEIGKADQERLISERKLVLLVDLDQTILHTTHEEVKNDPNVHSFTLWPGHPTYYTKLRPFLREFLEEMSKIYELHIFTFGCRKYAHKIASLIDPDQKFFGNRILSRDESVDQYSKKGNMNNLFPCGDAMVCIIDDRSDVWRDAGNLIQVKPYSYFKTSISDGAHRKDVLVEDDESLERDVDKLEALLGLDDNDESGEENEETPLQEPKIDIESSQSDGDQTSDSNEENLKKKTKTSSSSDTEEGEEEKKDERKRRKEEDIGNDRKNETKNCDEENAKLNENSNRSCPDENKQKEAEGEDDETLPESAKDLRIPTTTTKDGEQREKEDTDDENSSDTPSEPVEDPDEYLLLLPNILNRIHDKWYMELDEQRQFLVDGENYKLPDIKDIIRRYLRKKF